MEGLTVAASARDSMSLDLYCAESVVKHNKVWGLLRSTTTWYIKAVSSDLKVLSSALTQIDCEKLNTGLNDLNGYCIKFDTLAALLNELEPGFAPTSSPVCKWINFEPILKSDRLERSQDILKKSKVVSSMAQAGQFW